jgi:hypothetical protein
VSFLDADAFAFREKVPAELGHTRYCGACHAAHVAPALDAYAETMERAREVFIFFKTQKHPPIALRKAAAPARVTGCPDRDETILRLAFRAAEGGFNAVLGTEVVSEQVRNEGWQKSVWRGTGTPVEIDVAKLERQR